jgi:hypothetical protein
MADDGTAYDIGVETIYDLEDARFFIDFCHHHAEQMATRHGAYAPLSKSKLLFAHMRAAAGLKHIAGEIDGNGQEAVEPDSFKRRGYMCFWLRRAALRLCDGAA